MAKRARPAQGANTSSLSKRKKMPTNVQFSDYGIGADVHAKPVNVGVIQDGVPAPRKITRNGPPGGKRAPKDRGIRITPLS